MIDIAILLHQIEIASMYATQNKSDIYVYGRYVNHKYVPLYGRLNNCRVFINNDRHLVNEKKKFTYVYTH